MCDRYGPRLTMGVLLITGAIPMALAGLIKTGTGLIVLRLFIGVLGGTFVPCQFWTTAMFSRNVVGTANAFVGGWGNLGGGFTFIFMPGVFELVKFAGADEFLAWKIAVLVPALICIVTGFSVFFTSDDCPQGKWENRKFESKCQEILIKSEDREGTGSTGHADLVNELSPTYKDNISAEIKNGSTPSNITSKFWTYLTIAILIIQYGCCFGVEISTNTILNLYFLYRFKITGCVDEETISNGTQYSISYEGNTTSVLSGNMTLSSSLHTTVDSNKCSILNQNTASLIASLFGLMNIFARALGGICSDIICKYRGIAGRLLTLFFCLATEGIILICFSKMETISTAVVVLVFFSLFVQMSEGATYAIVPYVLPRHVGVVAGLVGAGGNAGALMWSTLWVHLVSVDPSRWFFMIGIIVFSCSFLSFLSAVQGERIWHIFKRTNKNTTEETHTTISDIE